MADNQTQVSPGAGAGSPGSPEDERKRRSRFFFLLAVVLVLCVCLAVGVAGAQSGGLFNLLKPPPPTATSAPADQPAATENVTETETEPATQPATPTDTPSPTTVVNTTPEVTQPVVQGSCTVIPGDGKCDVRCENTDLDPQDCTCNMNNVCDPGEGFNCPDCSYGQCGQACGSDADCHNPGLTCSNGVCGGPSCGSSGGGGGPTCKCQCPKGKGTCRVGVDSCTGKACRP